MKKIEELIKKYRSLLLVIVGIIVVICLFACLVNFVKEKGSSKKDLEYQTSFFIKNKDDLYALFNNKGKKLTDFIYSSTESFYNGVARVKTKNGKYGVINEKGKYIIKINKYDSISQHGSLFKVNEEDERFSLLNNKGKKIISKKAFELQSFTNVDSFVVVLKDAKYTVMNYNGKKIYSFKVNTKDDESIIPTANEYGDYGSVYYDGLTIIFNVKAGKIISKIKEDTHYCVNNVSEDEEMISLNSCVAWYEATDDTKYKVIVNKKVKDLPEECNKVTLSNDTLTCATNEGTFLIDKKFKVTETNLVNITYKNNENYAIKKDNGVEFVRNGKATSKLKDTILSDTGYSKEGIYLVYKDNKYSYYNEKGKKIFKKDYVSAIAFDTNSLARVSEDGENYYFINTKGKKVSDYFDLSYLAKDYYIITIEDQKGIMDKNGKMLVNAEYLDADIKTYNDETYAYLKKDDSYIVVNLKNKKKVLEVSDQPIFYENYIKVVGAKKINYYTYAGNKLLEEKA